MHSGVVASVAAVAGLTLLFAACSSGGSSDDSATAERPRAVGVAEEAASSGAVAIEIEMTEFAYDPDEITVPAGVPVRLVFHNAGAIAHEAMVGDAHMQEEFEAMGGHGAADHHGEVHGVTVAPGGTEALTMTFEGPGETMVGCHLPGHWPAGMAARVTVTAG